MTAKTDPYATRRTRAVDVALILFALLIIAIVLFTSPRYRSGTVPQPAKSQTLSSETEPASTVVNLAANTSSLTKDL